MKDLIEKFKVDAEKEVMEKKKLKEKQPVVHDLYKGPIIKTLFPYKNIMIIQTEVLATGPNDIPKHKAGKQGPNWAFVGTSCTMNNIKFPTNEIIATFIDFYIKDENLLYVNRKILGKNQQRRVENEQ